jgi:4-diphosphocytidyl-2C-methyl-D-erythritol kinase
VFERFDGLSHSASTGLNDLEEAALSIHPELLSTKAKLLETGFHTVCMSGSGSSFYAIGSEEQKVYLERDLPAVKICKVVPVCREPSGWFR